MRACVIGKDETSGKHQDNEKARNILLLLIMTRFGRTNDTNQPKSIDHILLLWLGPGWFGTKIRSDFKIRSRIMVKTTAAGVNEWANECASE
jgi:hypothetical protein